MGMKPRAHTLRGPVASEMYITRSEHHVQLWSERPTLTKYGWQGEIITSLYAENWWGPAIAEGELAILQTQSKKIVLDA